MVLGVDIADVREGRSAPVFGDPFHPLALEPLGAEEARERMSSTVVSVVTKTTGDWDDFRYACADDWTLDPGDENYTSTSSQLQTIGIGLPDDLGGLGDAVFIEWTITWTADGLPVIAQDPAIPSMLWGATQALGLTIDTSQSDELQITYLQADSNGSPIEFGNPLQINSVRIDGAPWLFITDPRPAPAAVTITIADEFTPEALISMTAPFPESGPPISFDDLLQGIDDSLLAPLEPEFFALPELVVELSIPESTTPESTTPPASSSVPAATSTTLDTPADGSSLPAVAEQATPATTSAPTTDPAPDSGAADTPPAPSESAGSDSGGFSLLGWLLLAVLVSAAFFGGFFWWKGSSARGSANVDEGRQSDDDADGIDAAALAIAAPGLGVLPDPCGDLRKAATEARQTFEIADAEATHVKELVDQQRASEPERPPYSRGTTKAKRDYDTWKQDLNKRLERLRTAANRRAETLAVMLDAERALERCERRHRAEEKQAVRQASDMSSADAPVPPAGTTKFKVRTILGGDVSIPWASLGKIFERVGKLPLGLAAYTVEVVDDENNQALYTFLGPGGGLSTPSAAGPGQWSEFETDEPTTVWDFEGWGTWSHTGAAVGVGGGITTMTFERGDLDPVKIDAVGGGFGVGAGSTTFSGWWELRD